MKLPIFKSNSKPTVISGGFGGIGEKSLLDMVNLAYSGYCKTRNPRKNVLDLSTEPDQIITCENRLFLRYANTLKEVIVDFDGSLKELTQEYILSELDPSPDRKLVGWEGKIYVFPDKLQIGLDSWDIFAENIPLSTALPFVNSRTLFYPEDDKTEGFCSDALNLKVGMKLWFPWVLDTFFTIKTIEDYLIPTDDLSGYVKTGRRITLDKDVPDYNCLPTDAWIDYCNPQNRPILNDLSIGFNHKVTFSGNKIIMTCSDTAYKIPLNEFFKIGQTVDISGSSVARNNTVAKIIDIQSNCLCLNHTFAAVEEAEKSEITITPVIPDLSLLLLTEDRLFGVDNEKGKFYISALKNPFLFYEDPAAPEDAWSVNISGTATGITLWKDNIICFTETGGFRILGYHANNFGIQHLPVNGIKKGCENSLSRVGDTLYYCSSKGVMRYSGGSDINVFDPTLQVKSIKASATDGVLVYMLDDNRIWVYDTNSKICWSEDGENISQIFDFDGKLYLYSNKAFYLADAQGENSVDWSFALRYLPDERFLKVQSLNFTLNYSENTDCTLDVYYKPFSDTVWKACGTYKIKGEGRIEIPLDKSYCNGFKIKVEGCGNFEPISWLVAYRKPK